MASLPALSPDELASAREQLQGYRYTLSDEGRFEREGRPLGVAVRSRRGRFVAVAVDGGRQLWAGGNLATFVGDFWHAERVS